MDPQLPAQLVQLLAPFLRWRVKDTLDAFLEGTPRQPVHQWSQRIYDCLPIRLFVPYSLTVRPTERNLPCPLLSTKPNN